MIDFRIDRERCTQCKQCVGDCPSRIIGLDGEGFPSIAPEKETNCLGCQHCLAICPEGALSILGYRPEESLLLKGGYPDPQQLETLIKGRRSVRRYRPENLDPELLNKLLDVAWHAPTGVNSRQVRFTVLDDRDKVARLRDEVMAGLLRLDREGALPASKSYYASFIRVWEKRQIDLIFRDAPHLLIASAPKSASTPKDDCMIALTSFELYAQASGVGTLWNGIASWAIDEMFPDIRRSLGIPDEHLFGYAMLFGKPAVHYARTVQHQPAPIHRVP
ncbi:4Fe-4S dicluster domain-containing protein [Chlorobaculum sp. 24CR]|uniref:nitroreductase family protein n=1 Tax=Chlorobaculum sp. 24CR TaxID=2508878 RepID=UPI00100C1784|nr:nitroreductase family protein [Chlorobaculum sp. 24CR]RXK79718.1 4Fe-4S dicluster domain-containing protein [Chlorobaculum sp. 24CR]